MRVEPTVACFDDAAEWILAHLLAAIDGALVLVYGLCTGTDVESYAHACARRTAGVLMPWRRSRTGGVIALSPTA